MALFMYNTPKIIRQISYKIFKKIIRKSTIICLMVPLVFLLTMVYKLSDMADFDLLQSENRVIKRKLILIYTPFFEELPWPDIPYNYNFTKQDGTSCPINHCELTYNKSRIAESDAVIFHGRDLPDPIELLFLRQEVNRTEQQWIWFMLESPVNVFFDIGIYDGIFNLSMTYNYDSDGVVPYYTMRKLRPNEKRPTLGTDFTEGRDKMVLYFNSNCLSFRTDFVEELKKYVEVDVYGKCKMYFDSDIEDCPRNSTRCEKLQKRYKFYLAFENSYCEDYVTEKLYKHGYEDKILPIVIGGANYSMPRIAFPNSLIDAQKFESVELLGEYINYLDRNDTAYNEHFEWTYSHTLEPREPMCVACKVLWEKSPDEKKTLELSTFWNRDTKCFDYEQILPYFY